MDTTLRLQLHFMSYNWTCLAWLVIIKFVQQSIKSLIISVTKSCTSNISQELRTATSWQGVRSLASPTLFKTTIQTIMTWIKINVFWPRTHSVNADSDWPDWRGALPTDSLHHRSSLAGSYAKLIPTWSHLHNFTDNIFRLVQMKMKKENIAGCFWEYELCIICIVMISISKLLLLLSTIVTMISGVCDNSHSFYYSVGQTQQKITSSPTHFLMHNWFLISNSKFVNDTVRIFLHLAIAQYCPWHGYL